MRSAVLFLDAPHRTARASSRIESRWASRQREKTRGAHLMVAGAFAGGVAALRGRATATAAAATAASLPRPPREHHLGADTVITPHSRTATRRLRPALALPTGAGSLRYRFRGPVSACPARRTPAGCRRHRLPPAQRRWRAPRRGPLHASAP